MENASLLYFWEADKEILLANLEKNRSPESVQAVLEREVDRVMLRYAEQCPDEERRAAAQEMLQAVKAALPMVGAVSDSRTWKKTLDTTEKQRKLSGKALGYLLAGVLLVLSTVLAAQLGQARFLLMSALRALIPAVLGGACLFRGGMLVAQPVKKADEPGVADVRVEYLVDTQKVWHAVRAAMLVADGRLDAIAEATDARRRAEETAAPESALPRETIELLSGLLEIAYSRRVEKDADALEMISSIRYYLHGADVDVVDYDDAHDAWFEFLPSPKPGTLRPALVAGGKLLKKGLASA